MENSISAEFQKVLKEDIPSAYERLCANPQLAVAIFSASAMVLGLCLLGIWAGIESANILTDGVAVSDYESNGQWYFNLRWMQSNVPSMKESAAANYKDDCYKNGAASRTSSNKLACNQFYHTSIPYTWTSNTSCPFDGDVCLQGSATAFTLSTDWTDTNLLGINAPESSRMRFQKTMTCNPVSNDEPWVSYDETGRSWLYFYHQCNDTIPTDPTFANPGDWSPYVGPLVGYSAKAVRMSAPFADWYRVPFCMSPRIEFRAGSSLVSLIFVVPLGEMMFTNYRDDPIFPAKDDAEPPWKKIGYQSKTTRADILGCVDSFQVCNSANTRCWDQGNWTKAVEMVKACHGPSSKDNPRCSGWSSLDPSPDERLILLLLDIALEDADAAGSILHRRGNGLEATKLIGANGPFTFLAQEQWKVEAGNLFQTSLARMQLNIFDFARGTYVDGQHAISERVPDYAANAYKLYKFPANGYKNIDGVWFIGTNMFCVLLFFWSRRYSTSQQREDDIRGGGDGGYHDNLWGTIALKKCTDLILLCHRKLCACYILLQREAAVLITKDRNRWYGYNHPQLTSPP